MLTQQPTFLDKHVRGLVDTHTHMVRRAGFEASQTYTWEQCKEEPETPANLELADGAIWTFPKEYYGMYKSADVHTIKRKFPMRLKLISLGMVAVLGMFWFAFNSLKAKTVPEPTDSAAASAAGTDVDERPDSRGRRVSYATPQAFLTAHQPRIPAFPGSAPVFDDRKVKSEPEIFCMASGEGRDTSCGCMTEQGTRYHLDKQECEYIARHGAPYNPYKAPARGNNQRERSSDDSRPAGNVRAMASADAASSPAAMIEGDQVSGYGELGERKITAAP